MGEASELHIVGDASLPHLGHWAIDETVKDGHAIARAPFGENETLNVRWGISKEERCFYRGGAGLSR